MHRRIHLLVGLAILAGCGERSVTTTGLRHQSRVFAPSSLESFGADVESDLAALRRVTAPFQEFDVARAAGWGAKITACMTDPAGSGGMGFHYGNTTLIDGTVRVDEPELLLYEPQQNGRLRLVAVEYIVPYTFHSRDADPPMLFGHQFQRNDVFQLWGLHAWVWKDNPSGMFANWNPTVNCDNTTDRMAMVH
jgi:hypothetical protein